MLYNPAVAKKTRRPTTGGKAASGGPNWFAGSAPELDLHALTVVEALPRLDEFLHSSFRAGHYRVRIVHGKGTGVLKVEVGRYLASHPLVLRYQAADVYHGGVGATEVDLTDR
jgi:DNA mismatch repair protein MutS2